MVKGETLQRLRVLLQLKQADVARLIPRYDGTGAIDDTTLSRIEAGHLEPTEAFVWAYLEALCRAKGEHTVAPGTARNVMQETGYSEHPALAAAGRGSGNDC